jgi:hypothetical protein
VSRTGGHAHRRTGWWRALDEPFGAPLLPRTLRGLLLAREKARLCRRCDETERDQQSEEEKAHAAIYSRRTW